jgi:hypothetical protein
MALRTKAAPAKGAAETSIAPAAAFLPPGVSDDELFIQQAGGVVVTFLRSAREFLVRANALETHALAKLDAAKTWPAPTSAEEDVFLQEQIKDANGLKKEIVEHWKITSLVSQFHKRLTGRRDKGVTAAEEIAAIGNNLHNGWTIAEKERVRRLHEQERQQAELDAQMQRERELQEMERAAIEAEEGRPDLSERESRFVDLVFGGLNAPTTAARSVGFKDPALQAERLMKSPKIQKAIESRLQAQAIRKQKEARSAAPLVTRTVPTIKPDIQKAAGAHDRTTYSIEFTDGAAFRAAAFSGQYGIPQDIFEASQAKGNEYARSMRELVNRWPGCRLVTKTGVV